ncbi:MAG TPA: formate dehydrogenase subunit gamma [Myxococcaceae bacterium]|nr:formate dehydrogenase subunit gamma [Myxococcaceae bacterium]
MAQVVTPPNVGHADPAIAVARTTEDVLVGERIVRHTYASRVMHWLVGGSFILSLLTGLPIWTPIFGWMAYLFGGLQVCRWLHPFLGVVFSAGLLWMAASWWSQMSMTAKDREWLSPGYFAKYLRFEATDPDTGKYNGGQKALFWFALLGGLALFLSGLVLWFPSDLSQPLREIAWVLHDAAFIAFFLMIIGHVYLAIVEPGTFESMIDGTVSKAWARLHHPRWYRDVTGDQRK